MKRIEQTELPLQIKHRCKECNRPIKNYGYGYKCKRKIVDNFVKNVPEQHWNVILEYLTKELNKNVDK